MGGTKACCMCACNRQSLADRELTLDAVQNGRSRAGLSASSLSAHLTLVPNPTRTLYAHYGLSEPLALSSVLGPSVLSAVFTLKSESGIANTATGRGSDRWQNSGGLAVDQSGTVRWRKIAKDASDRCRWEEAKTALLA